MAKAVLGVLGVAAGLALVSSGAQGQGARQGARHGAAIALPPGPGREVVQTVCVACHEPNRITFSGGYDHEGWSQAVDRTVAVGAPLPADRKAEVIGYLAAHFPEKPSPTAG